METDVYAFGCLYYAVRPMCPSIYNASSNDLGRYSLIPFLLRTEMNIKSCGLSQQETDQSENRAQQWEMVYGTSFTDVGAPILLIVPQ